jgi:GAF domain-containing protein
MWNKFKAFFRPPTFPDNEAKSRIARNTNATSIALVILIILYELASIPRIQQAGILILDYIIVGLGITILLLWVALKRGAVALSASALVGIFWLAANGTAFIGDGLRSTSFIANLPAILLAALLLGWRASLIYSLAGTLAAFGLAYLESTGQIVPETYPPFAQATDLIVILFLTGILVYFIVADLTSAMSRLNTNTRLLETNLTELQSAQTELMNKTSALEKRTSQLLATNAVTQVITNAREIEVLLPVTVHSITEHFGYYHTGLYLVDDKFENAYLQASSSDGGKKMLARQHQVALTEEGILQRAISKRSRQVAQDIQPDLARLEHPELTFTRARAVFPFLVRERVIGVLDIHASEPDAFQETDLENLQIIADQFGLAIDNARLLSDMEAVIEQSQQTSDMRAYISWRELTHRKSPVYQYTPLAVQKIGMVPEHRDEASGLSVPILLRGKNIGKIHLRRKSGSGAWLAQEQAMVHEVAAQVALALENARLLEDAQARASRERSLSEIGARISAAVDVEAILRTTAQEIGKILGDSEVAVQLNPEVVDA